MTVDWSDVDEIRREWPHVDLDVERDRADWVQGCELFDGDTDYDDLMRCVELLCPAAAHRLYGAGVLTDDELSDTIHKVLYAASERPPDGRTFATEARRALRLAVTLAREHGWGPAEYGGSGRFDVLLVEELDIKMLVMAALGEPSGRPALLEPFFTAPRQLPERGSLVTAPVDVADELLESSRRIMHLEVAASRGDLRAMTELVEICDRDGDFERADYWANRLRREGEDEALAFLETRRR